MNPHSLKRDQNFCNSLSTSSNSGLVPRWVISPVNTTRSHGPTRYRSDFRSFRNISSTFGQRDPWPGMPRWRSVRCNHLNVVMEQSQSGVAPFQWPVVGLES